MSDLKKGRRMVSQTNKRRMNVEGDRLSSLSDDLIAKILSYNGIKQAVETSVLSSRWKYIWTSVPYLNFSSEDFSNKIPKFYKFLTHVFSSCKDQVEFSLNLRGKVSQVFIKKILKDALSRNVQKLTFSILHEKLIELDLSLFSSQSLKHLSLIGPELHKFPRVSVTPTSMWELPALTTLHLNHFTLYDDDTNKCVGLISKCTNLKNLILDNYRVRGAGSLTISHPHISNLSIVKCGNVVKVVTPQLKNLSIVDCFEKLMISAPDLTTLIYKNHYFDIFVDSDSLPSLEKVDLCVHYHHSVDVARKFVNLLQKFHNVRFLTLSLEIIETISSSVELIAHQPSPFHNLKNLRIYPESLGDSLKGEVIIPSEVKNYLLDSSPRATFTMVSRKELRAVRDAKLAQVLMKELRVLLNHEKAHMKSHKAVIKLQPMNEMPLNMSQRVTQIERYWVDLNKPIDNGKTKTISIIKLIERIKGLLINLPISKKAEMQPDFSSLCAEADSIMDEIINRMKTECGEKGSSLGVCLHELVTAAKSSS